MSEPIETHATSGAEPEDLETALRSRFERPSLIHVSQLPAFAESWRDVGPHLLLSGGTLGVTANAVVPIGQQMVPVEDAIAQACEWMRSHAEWGPQQDPMTCKGWRIHRRTHRPNTVYVAAAWVPATPTTKPNRFTLDTLLAVRRAYIALDPSSFSAWLQAQITAARVESVEAQRIMQAEAMSSWTVQTPKTTARRTKFDDTHEVVDGE